MNISVIGTGYVGLVVGACLAETGNTVVCADVDRVKIEGLKRNHLPIYEPGLSPLVERNQQHARLQFTDDVAAAIASAAAVWAREFSVDESQPAMRGLQSEGAYGLSFNPAVGRLTWPDRRSSARCRRRRLAGTRGTPSTCAATPSSSKRVPRWTISSSPNA